MRARGQIGAGGRDELPASPPRPGSRSRRAAGQLRRRQTPGRLRGERTGQGPRAHLRRPLRPSPAASSLAMPVGTAPRRGPLKRCAPAAFAALLAPELGAGGRAERLAVPLAGLRRSPAVARLPSFWQKPPLFSRRGARPPPSSPRTPSPSPPPLPFLSQAHCLLLFLSLEILYLPPMTSLRPGRAQGEQPRALSKPSLRVQRRANGGAFRSLGRRRRSGASASELRRSDR